MDCNRAEEAMMQYIDKTIKPSDAKALALHLLNCESCREYFTALDMTMDALEGDEMEFLEAPEGFTETVMAKVSELPVYHEKAKKVRNYSVAIRIAGGLCVVLTGLVLFLTSGTDPSNTLNSILSSVDAWFTQLNISSFLQSAILSAPNLSITALIFAGIISILLFTLQRGEHQNDDVKA